MFLCHSKIFNSPLSVMHLSVNGVGKAWTAESSDDILRFALSWLLNLGKKRPWLPWSRDSSYHEIILWFLLEIYLHPLDLITDHFKQYECSSIGIFMCADYLIFKVHFVFFSQHWSTLDFRIIQAWLVNNGLEADSEKSPIG